MSKKVIDEISDKLNIKELDLDSTIDTTINILENLKRDLPYSAEKRLWNEFNQSVSELHKIKGEINAYYYAKQISSIMKVDKKQRRRKMKKLLLILVAILSVIVISACETREEQADPIIELDNLWLLFVGRGE